MPTLRTLIDQGASGVLESTLPALTAPAWTAFQTGRDVSTTGIFNFAAWDKHQKRIRCLFAQTCRREFITCLLSDHGFERHTARFNLGTWLAQEGYLAVNPRSPHAPWFKKLTKRLRVGKILSAFLPPRTIETAEKALRLDVALTTYALATWFQDRVLHGDLTAILREQVQTLLKTQRPLP